MSGVVFRRIIVALAAVVLFLGPVVGGLLYQGHLRFNYPSLFGYSVFGIDVSHHQGEIDWGVLQQEDLDFAWIKATEGKDFHDTRFEYNWQLAKQVGIKRGAYHFFTFCSPGKSQAEHYISVVSDADLPPAVDVEYGGNCKNRPDDARIQKELSILLAKLEEHYGRKPVIYTTEQAWQSLVKNRFADYPLWIRSTVGTPDKSVFGSWTFWQYSARGHLQGVDGWIDLNTFSGDIKRFETLLESR